jgi:hypothetical protein
MQRNDTGEKPTRLTLYVPVDAKGSHIAGGSAIVGSPGEDQRDATERLVIDFEGNVYNAENLQDYAGRLQCAAGRHADRCPTVARRHVDVNTMHAVGSAAWISGVGWVVERLDDPAALQAWLAGEPLPQLLGSPNQRNVAVSRRLQHLRPSELSKAQAQARSSGKQLLEVLFEAIVADHVSESTMPTLAFHDSPHADGEYAIATFADGAKHALWMQGDALMNAAISRATGDVLWDTKGG